MNLTVDELKVYVAILLVTGYMTPKNIRMFWEQQSDTYNKMVSDSMRRNRFLEIQRYIHLCDNQNLATNDKFSKLRKYFDLLNSIFLQNVKICGSSHLSIDESMVPYYGRHSSKQHIQGKPIRFGYKIWAIATRNGYLAAFEPYQGSKSCPLPEQENFGLGAAVVLELTSRLPQELQPYNIYIDNFFTGFPLLRKLTELNIGCTGTVRNNRTENCPLPDPKTFKKTRRGTYAYKNTEDMIVVRWNDNNIVTVASNCHGVNPI